MGINFVDDYKRESIAWRKKHNKFDKWYAWIVYGVAGFDFGWGFIRLAQGEWLWTLLYFALGAVMVWLARNAQKNIRRREAEIAELER